MAEVVIERPVFLGNDNDVVNRGDIVLHLRERCVDIGALIIRDRQLTGCAATVASEAGEGKSRGGRRREGNRGSITETGAARRWTINSRGAAGDRSLAGNCNRHLCGIGGRSGEGCRNRLITGERDLTGGAVARATVSGELESRARRRG